MNITAKLITLKHLKSALQEVREGIQHCGSLTYRESKLSERAVDYYSSLLLSYEEAEREINSLIITL